MKLNFEPFCFLNENPLPKWYCWYRTTSFSVSFFDWFTIELVKEFLWCSFSCRKQLKRQSIWIEIDRMWGVSGGGKCIHFNEKRTLDFIFFWSKVNYGFSSDIDQYPRKGEGLKCALSLSILSPKHCKKYCVVNFQWHYLHLPQHHSITRKQHFVCLLFACVWCFNWNETFVNVILEMLMRCNWA